MTLLACTLAPPLIALAIAAFRRPIRLRLRIDVEWTRR
jgi:hypothetical protein